MKLVVFGLTVSSSWGNGHATLWRGLCRALGARGHRVIFFERDLPYYAAHRDMAELLGGELYLYADWARATPLARDHLADADVALVTSYCPDGLAATDLVLSSPVHTRVFYDLDTPVTLERLEAGLPIGYIGPEGLGGFDLVLSYTGGATLMALERRLGARRTAPLYGSVDPRVHFPVPAVPAYACDLSYLGTYAEDRQVGLETFFLEPARRLPQRRFAVGGSLYPPLFPWRENISYMGHVSPQQHRAFYCSSTLTLNLTRAAMARMGYCPSGRLFEAAACRVPILSDEWEGLEEFLQPGCEILVCRTTEEVLQALALPRAELAKIARAARERVLDEHTADRRARQLEEILSSTSACAPAESALAGVAGGAARTEG